MIIFLLLQKMSMVPLKKRFRECIENACNAYKFFYRGCILFGLSLDPFPTPFPVVIDGYRWLTMVIDGYRWLSMVIDGSNIF